MKKQKNQKNNQNDIKIIQENRKATHDYFIEEKYEAGVVLLGSEVKSIRNGRMNLKDSYCIVRNDGVYLINAHISPYKFAEEGIDPRRTRKLLLNKNEVNRLRGRVENTGYTLIPLNAYFKGGLVKITVAVAKGKVGRDKRKDIKERDLKREVDRYLKNKR